MTGRYSLPIVTVPPVDLTPYASKHAPAFTGTAVFGGAAHLSDGTPGAPALAFAGDTDTGLHRPGNDTLSLVAGGVERVTVAADAIRLSGPGTVRGVLHGGNSDTVPFVGSYNAGGDLSAATYGFGFINRNTDGHLRLVYRKGTTADVTALHLNRDTGAMAFGGAIGMESLRVNATANAVNRLQVTGAATGGAPALAADGADAQVDLALTPKGTGGRVRFGTHTATADAPITGSIEIRDAGGTIRKLAVIS
ncbi:hypothetical protein [Azospirillum sp.]|uniref:hypothetical protein n=1 Tax=Azospirillum sp. TaxID=34012 RepID=UPI002D36B2CB|nr:hypothetical protein [Azospirillum sp.]HYD63886.1 hypothetical protein [Azospirillum sp.]